MKTETKTVVAALRKMAQMNKVALDVFHMWAMRQRARHSVTIVGLTQRMKAEGFQHTPGEYGNLLAALAVLGIGTLEKDAKGRPVALTWLTISLQSLGVAAIDNTTIDVMPFKQRNRYEEIAPTPTPISRPAPSAPVKVFVAVGGRTIELVLPTGMSPTEMAAVIASVQESKVAA